LLAGLNVWDGRVTCQPVAAALELPLTPPEQAIT
jgi:alanine dehydrogenase